MRVISNSSSEEPIRNEKKYLKSFIGSILLLILGILLLSIGSLIITFADPQTQQELLDLLKVMNGFNTFGKLFLQLGMVLFSLSTFLGAMRNTTLSGEVRKGMAIASAIGILALGILLITLTVSLPYY